MCEALTAARTRWLKMLLSLLEVFVVFKLVAFSITEALRRAAAAPSATKQNKNPKRRAARQRAPPGGLTALESFQESFIFASV